MPIGKSSIKRVKDGYSNVKSTAPDMENSTVLANPAPEVVEMVAPKKKAAPKAAPKASAKKSAPKKATPKKKTAPKISADEERPEGFKKIALGDEMPDYLL